MYLNRHRLDIWLSTNVGVAYVGPGDVVASATAWWGLRAYSSATIGSNVVRLRRSSDNTTQDFVSLADGSLDVASIATFKGAGQVFVNRLYDGTGGGFTMTAASSATEPELVLNDLGTRPAIIGVPANSTEMTNSIDTITTPQPYSMSCVVKNTNNGSQQAPISLPGTIGILINNGGANLVLQWANGGFRAAYADGSPQTVNTVYNGASSNIFVNGVRTTGTSGADSPLTNAVYLLSFSGTGFFNGSFYEAGFWPLGFSNLQEQTLDANQRAYWGF